MRYLIGPGAGLKGGHPLPVLLVGFPVKMVQQGIYSTFDSACGHDGEYYVGAGDLSTVVHLIAPTAHRKSGR